MIIYRENQPPLLSDYGIEVPMLKGRAEKIKNEVVKKFGSKFLNTKNLPILNEDDLLLAHTKTFIDRCKATPDEVIEEAFELINKDGSYNRYNPKNARKPLSEMVQLYKESCAASYLTLLEAHKENFSYYLGGGFHHALANQGRGFCLFNDIVVAAKKFQKNVRSGQIWIIDIDAHKGCGTAEITKDDDNILSLSIHMKDGWPLDSEKLDFEGNLNPWFIPSSIDIPIASGEESTYLTKLQSGLTELSAMSKEDPVLCIVVDGSDPFDQDALPSAGLLNLTQDQCLKRNMLVYNFLKQRNIPQAYLMSGGYGDKNWVIHYQFIEQILSQHTKIEPL
jgi:acetoin utilization deacetylase AcuC-like enzyme